MSAVEAVEPLVESSNRVAASPWGGRRRGAALRLLVPHQSRLSRFPFLLGLVALLAVGMGGLVVVNTQIQTQASALSDLQQQAKDLEHQQAQLQAEIDKRRSASTLQVNAYKLGMRPNPRPAFIVLPAGKILGTPTKVTGNELPDQVYLTWQQALQRQEAARAAVAKQRAAEAAAAKKKAAAEAEAAKKKAAAEAKKKAEAQARTKAEAQARKKTEQDTKRPNPSTKPTTPGGP